MLSRALFAAADIKASDAARLVIAPALFLLYPDRGGGGGGGVAFALYMLSKQPQGVGLGDRILGNQEVVAR